MASAARKDATTAPAAPPPAEDLVAVEGKAPDAAELISEVARLRSELEAALLKLESQAQRHRAELEDLSAQHRQAYERLQQDLRDQDKNFRDAWTRRELEIELLRPEPTPTRPKRRVFAFSCIVVKDGARQAVAPGDAVSPNMDLTGLPSGAVVEE